MNKHYYVYILSNKNHTVYYTGVTNDLVRRVYEHKKKFVEGFTKKYFIDNLLYYEQYNTPSEAIKREKQIKDYRRQKKLSLIESLNPLFEDYYTKISRPAKLDSK